MIGAAAAPECTPVFVTPPSLDVHVAVWLVIALPLFAPIVNVTVNAPVATVVEPDTAFTPVGALGTVRGVTVADNPESAPVPTLFTAATRNRYEVPLLNPVNV